MRSRLTATIRGYRSPRRAEAAGSERQGSAGAAARGARPHRVAQGSRAHDPHLRLADRAESTGQLSVCPRSRSTCSIPASGAYKTISSESLTLTAAGSAPAGTSADAKLPRRTSRPSKPAAKLPRWPPLHTQHSSSPSQAAARLTRVLPDLAVALSLALDRRRVRTAARWRACAHAAAGGAEQIALKNAQKRLDAAQNALNNQDAKRFHAEISAALSAALEARLGENVTGLTQHQLQRFLKERGMPPVLTAQLSQVLAHCDFARFSSASVSAADMQHLHTQAERLWSEVASFEPGVRESKESA